MKAKREGRFKLVLIGAGFISYSHFFAARAISAMRPVALASHSRRNAEHRARIFGIPAYTFDRIDEMLEKERPDVAIVSSPVSFHFEHSLKALRAGCHVIIEKPMVIRMSEARRLREAAEASGAMIAYAENQVFSPLIERMAGLIGDGAIGTVVKVRGEFEHGGPLRGTWFYRESMAGGGAQMDLGPHTIETCLFLAGRPGPVRVRSAEIRVDESHGLDALAECVLDTDRDISIESSCSWLNPEMKCVYRVEGTKGFMTGYFSGDMGPHRLIVTSAAGVEREIEVMPGFRASVGELIAKGGYTAQLAHFAECFEKNTMPAEGVAEGERVLRVICASYRAARTRSSVDLSLPVPDDSIPFKLYGEG